MTSKRWVRGLGIVTVGAWIALGAGHGVAAAAPGVTNDANGSATPARSDQSSEAPTTAAGGAEHDGKQRDSADTGPEPAKSTSTVSASTVTVDKDHPAAKPELVTAAAGPSKPSKSFKRIAVPTSVARKAGSPAAVTPERATSARGEAATEAVQSEAAQPKGTTQRVVSTTQPHQSQPESVPADVVATPAAVSVVPAMTAPRPPNLINVIGTLLFTVLTSPLKLLEKTPVVPAGYSVTVGKSTLDIGCGCGQSVDARWYFPDPAAHEGAAPQSLIYLQHGFLRSNSALSALAIELAQRTDSVVVAPTLTSNFFAADGCWINGEATQQAVADLFVGARTALTESAVAAGWQGGALPTRFILSGQSAGGALAAAAASDTVDNGSVSDLALVVMFDGVPFNDFLPAALAKLGEGPNERQVLQIASPPYFVNLFGKGTKQLVAARPGQFVGVQLAGGKHADAEGPSTDIVAQLAAGFSLPQNVKAVQTIAVGWINDVLNGIPAGVGVELGQNVTIPTTAGDATALVLGSPVGAAPQTLPGNELFTQNSV